MATIMTPFTIQPRIAVGDSRGHHLAGLSQRYHPTSPLLRTAATFPPTTSLAARRGSADRVSIPGCCLRLRVPEKCPDERQTHTSGSGYTCKAMTQIMQPYVVQVCKLANSPPRLFAGSRGAHRPLSPQMTYGLPAIRCRFDRTSSAGALRYTDFFPVLLSGNRMHAPSKST